MMPRQAVLGSGRHVLLLDAPRLESCRPGRQSAADIAGTVADGAACWRTMSASGRVYDDMRQHDSQPTEILRGAVTLCGRRDRRHRTTAA